MKHASLRLLMTLTMLTATLFNLEATEPFKTLTMKHDVIVRGDLTVEGDLIVEGDINFEGDVNLAPCSTLHLNEVGPTEGYQTTCFNGNLAVRPCTDEVGPKLLANELSAVTLTGDEYCERLICLEDPCGTICVNSNLAILPITEPCTRTLLVNNISPVKAVPADYTACTTCIADDAPCAATSFGGDIKIRDHRIIGATPTMYLLSNEWKRILCLTFENCSNDQSSAQLSTGAVANFEGFGLGTCHDEYLTTSFFDVFIEFKAFNGPGSFDNQTVGMPSVLYGNSTGMVLDGLEIRYVTDEYDPCNVWIEVRVQSPTNCILDCLAVTFCYDICSTNISEIVCAEPGACIA
jgi:hypothetical protein